MQSDVERYWEAIRAAYGSTRKWNELHPQDQMILLQAINMTLDVLNRN